MGRIKRTVGNAHATLKQTAEAHTRHVKAVRQRVKNTVSNARTALNQARTTDRRQLTAIKQRLASRRRRTKEGDTEQPVRLTTLCYGAEGHSLTHSEDASHAHADTDTDTDTDTVTQLRESDTEPPELH